MKSLLKFFLILLPVVGNAQELAGGFWYALDPVSNQRMVYPVDTLFLLDEVRLQSGRGHEFDEFEGFYFQFDSSGIMRACADYLQQIEVYEGEKGLMIYEKGCSDQKYKKVEWEVEAGDSTLNLTLEPLSRQAEISRIRYRYSFPETGVLLLIKDN